MEYVKLGGIVSLYAIHLEIKKQIGGLNKRKIIVYGSTEELNSFKEYSIKYEKALQDRNVEIIYKQSPIFYIELYGYDGGLKKSISRKDLDILIKEIDNMQMGRIEKMLREKK